MPANQPIRLTAPAPLVMSEPRYMQLARTLIHAVRDGTYPQGSLLPPEMELADRYEMSRHTVRAAIRQLQASGLVSRRAGVGTRVEMPAAPSVYRHSLTTIDDLVQFGENHVRRVEQVDDMVMSIETANELDCAPGSSWRWIGTRRLDYHTEPPKTICWTDNYIDPAHAEIIAAVRAHPNTLICRLIEQRYQRRTLKVRQNVSATSMSTHAACVLGVADGTPALRVVRHYLDELDDIFMITRTLHPPEHYKLRSMLMHTGEVPISTET